MSNTNKPDFSYAQGGVKTTGTNKPDFSNVQSEVTSTEEITEGGGGGTGEQTYTVQTGDNLSKIAASFYGKQDWKRIYDANRDQLDDPDKISPGQMLKIPAAD